MDSDLWGEEGTFRRALIGELTEVFNMTEFILHAVASWNSESSPTVRSSARDLVKTIKSRCKNGDYGIHAEAVRSVIAPLGGDDGLIERRDVYVHSWWDTARDPKSDEWVAVHARMRDFREKGDITLQPFDIGDISRLINGLEAATERALRVLNDQLGR